MKKVTISIIALALLSSLSLYAQETRKGSGGYYHKDSNTYTAEPEKELTPENSVLVFYTTSGCNTKIVYTQMNPTKSAAAFAVSSEGMLGLVALLPVEPGSFLKSIGGVQVMGNTAYLFTTEVNKYYPIDIKVPSKPGLYYAGNFVGDVDYSSFENFKKTTKGSIVMGAKNEEEFNKALKQLEEKALKALLKKYKGTAWESAINARVEELSK